MNKKDVLNNIINIIIDYGGQGVEDCCPISIVLDFILTSSWRRGRYQRQGRDHDGMVPK